MIDAIITGLILGFALALSVGPVVFTVIKLRLNYSLSSAFYFILGVWLSDFLWIITSNFFGGLLSEIIVFKKKLDLLEAYFLLALVFFIYS